MQSKISSFAHLIKSDAQETALFNALWLRVIIVESRFVPFLEALIAGDCLEEASERFASIVDLPQLVSAMHEEMFFDIEADQKKLREIKEAIDQLPIRVMYLITSLECNLACTYCYLSSSLNPQNEPKLMSKETARMAIDIFAQEVQKGGPAKPKIIFYGGEPTLNWPVIAYTVGYAKQLLPECEFTLVTNGTQIDNEKARFIVENNIAAAISIDGPAELHNSVRVDRGGGPTFGRALSGFRRIQEHGGTPGLSCTITPANVETLPKTISWLHQALGLSTLGFNIMLCEDNKANESFIEKASEMLVECFKYTRENGIYEDRMMRRVNSLADGTVAFNDCAGCGQQLVVTPNNEVGVCQGFMNTGDNFVPLTESFDSDQHLWTTWRKRSPFNMDECLGCVALGMCGGGCPYRSYLHKNDIMKVDSHHCIHAKTALRFMIADLLENNAECLSSNGPIKVDDV